MSDWQRNLRHLDTDHRLDVFAAVRGESGVRGGDGVHGGGRSHGDGAHSASWGHDETGRPAGPEPAPDRMAARVTAAGAEWLASASSYPRSTLALWSARPTAPVVLPCGSVFDVINVPAVFGRRMLSRLWSDGPGSGPVAAHRGRMLMFTAPGTAHRLPALLGWVGNPPTKSGGEWGEAVPPLLCHGAGDAVTVPPLNPPSSTEADGSRWLVAPDVRHPWLPGTEVLLWACVQAGRSGVLVPG